MKKIVPTAKKKTAKPRRATPQKMEKRIQAGKRKKIAYLIAHDDWVEFNPPAETNWNRFLANDKPLEKVDTTGILNMKGNLGSVKRFFISPAELKTVRDLFQRFQIPERLHHDLIWCYLNMVFAGAMAIAGEQFGANLDRSLQGLHRLFDLLASLSEGSHRITAATITIDTGDPNKKGGKELRTLKMNGPLDTGFLEDTLKLYQQVEHFEVLNKFYEIDKQKAPDRLGRNMGHKNAQKHKQSYYANALFDFLLKNVFDGLGAITHDLPRLKQETDRLKKIYPDRRLCYFIGLLMFESGLLPAGEYVDDDSLIDLMKKKLAGPLSRRAENRKRWGGKNDQSK